MLCSRRGRKRNDDTSGFSFLEVLVALCVISISIVALLNSHTASLKNYLNSQILSRATMLAEEKINEIEAKGIPQINDEEANEYDNGLRYVTAGGMFYDEEETEEYQPGWRRDYWWRTTVEETDYDGVWKIVVEVFWQRFLGGYADVAPWVDEQASPKVVLITYTASTNTREDARSGSSTSRRRESRRTGGGLYTR